jgi:hypothetical protein
MTDNRPDPIHALNDAAKEMHIALPKGLIEEILELESDTSTEHSTRTRTVAALMRVIETRAKLLP